MRINIQLLFLVLPWRQHHSLNSGRHLVAADPAIQVNVDFINIQHHFVFWCLCQQLRDLADDQIEHTCEHIAERTGLVTGTSSELPASTGNDT